MAVTTERLVGELPEETGRLVGRRAELAQVVRLCGRSRLVTVTGVGGVGKTRLTRRAAGELQRSFADGVWWVELSPLSEASHVLPYAIAETLPLADQSTRPMLEVVAEYLAEREMLLVLDTCEHLVEDCRTAVAALLAAAPGLRFLVTGRRTLGLPAEEVLTLDPLPVPAADDDADPDGEAADALVLLAERAAEAVPGFTLTAADRAEAGRLCRRLEGLPLALELAAARLRELPLAELNRHLTDRYATLGNTENEDFDADPPWHQAMRTAIGWSHQLCTPAERLAWARLSVFAGTFDTAAVRQVCADELLPDAEIPGLLGALVDKSLLAWVPTGAGERYRMLDTIREHGAFWLRGLGEEDELRRRHRDHYLALARWGDAAWIGPDQFAWFDRMTAEHDNLRAALEHSLAEPDEEHTALELTAALWFFWYGCGFLKEGRVYLDRALAADTAPSEERAKALYVCSQLLLYLGDRAALEDRAAECAVLARQFGETERRYVDAIGLRLAALRDDPAQVVSLAEAQLATDWRAEPLAYAPLAALVMAAHAHATAGRFTEAVAFLEELSEVCDRDGERCMRAWGDTIRSQAELGRGRFDAAREHARAALVVKYRLREGVGSGMALDVLARAATATGDTRHAAWLLGLATQLWDTLGRSQAGVPSLTAARRACERRTREALGDDAYETAYRSGYDTDLHTGVTLALDPGRTSWCARPAAPPAPLPPPP
ncbi:ATP-binding protein [Streptomyces sp. NPDC087300]|uniref:ATP-binding protein n=1 Tax=Streptomyces sp. NPDC087300 TaxID=3365780 RepID=UPI0038001E44